MRDEEDGTGIPVGNTRRWPASVGWVTVMLAETAQALVGIWHRPATGKVREVAPTSAGASAPRVSTSRQGGTVWKLSFRATGVMSKALLLAGSMSAKAVGAVILAAFTSCRAAPAATVPVTVKVACPVDCVVTEAALSVLLLADAKVTCWLAMPAPLESVNDTVYVPELANIKLGGPVRFSFVPVTSTGTVAVALPAVAVTVIFRFVGSPAALSVAVAAPLASVVPCVTVKPPESDVNVTKTPVRN